MKKSDDNFKKELEDYFDKNTDTTWEKLSNFTKFVPNHALIRFITKYEIFKKILNVHGSIAECGGLFGGGIMSWAHLSAMLEPSNYTRKIIGFDTFKGFSSISNQDKFSISEFEHTDGIPKDALTDLKKCKELFDAKQIELVKGNVVNSVPKYLKDNPHTIVSLLYLDMDIYKPTKVALKNFLPHMPKGSIIVFDEINMKKWKGESIAVLESLNINKFKIERFSFDTHMSYTVIE